MYGKGHVDYPVGHESLGYQVTCLGLVFLETHRYQSQTLFKPCPVIFMSLLSVLAHSFLAIYPCFGKVLCVCILEAFDPESLKKYIFICSLEVFKRNKML